MDIFNFKWHDFHSQTMDIGDMAIHPVVYHGNGDFQNSQKRDPLQIPAKILSPKYASLSKIFWCKKWTHGALQKYFKI
jgi:hypothetical protein